MNRFRSTRIRPVFEQVFTSVVLLLADAGMVDLDILPGRHEDRGERGQVHVRVGKSTDRYAERLRAKVHAHLAAIDELNDRKRHCPRGARGHRRREEVRQAADEINRRLREKRESKDPGEQGGGQELKRADRALQKGLPAPHGEVRAAEGDPGRPSQLLQDRPRRHVHAHEGRPHGQRPAEGRLQRPNRHIRPVHHLLHPSPPPRRHRMRHPSSRAPAPGCSGASRPTSSPTRATAARRTTPTFRRRGSTLPSSTNEFFREIKNPKWRNDPFRPANWAYDEGQRRLHVP